MDDHGPIEGLEAMFSGGLNAGTFFSAADYPELCGYAMSANTVERGTVSLVLPVFDPDDSLMLVPDALRESAGEFVTLVCVDISPRTAFLLASNLPLHKPTRDALSDNGLSIQGLSLREVLVAMQRTSDQITPGEF